MLLWPCFKNVLLVERVMDYIIPLKLVWWSFILIGQGHCIYNSMTSKKDLSWDSDAEAVLCHRILKQSAGKTWHGRGGNFDYASLDFRHPRAKHVWILLAGAHKKGTCPSMISLCPWLLASKANGGKAICQLTCLLCGSISSQTFEICYVISRRKVP